MEATSTTTEPKGHRQRGGADRDLYCSREPEASAAAIVTLLSRKVLVGQFQKATVEVDALVLHLLLDEGRSIEEQVNEIEKELLALGLPPRDEWNP
jgi:hypothetical protein